MAQPVTDRTDGFSQRCTLGRAGGLRVAVKDCLDVAGLPTRCGSAAFADAPVARKHAHAVAALLEAGCEITGKTVMHELAYGMTGVNPYEGTPINPRWPALIPGGSSSGAAVAVASGAVDFAIGTDTGGSVRQPATCCGVIGLKPSFGRIDRAGARPAHSSLDCIGPLARSMDMIEAAMRALDPGFIPERLARAPNLARVRTEFDRALGDSLLFALQEQDYDLPYVNLPGMDAAYEAGLTLIGHEAHLAFGDLLAQGAPLGADVRARLVAAGRITQAQVDQAEAVRARFTAEVDAVLSGYDAIVTRALPTHPPRLDEAEDPAKVLPLTRYLRPFNLSGHPAIVLPMASAEGLPAGLQIIAPKGADARLCAIARWLCETVPALNERNET
ncbi:glutamyl-tRNA amidotransferase [Thioclava dalianensis]|uniref:Glutamyl-tRNA amidotransferase n=2 Tax=Thioclava dalianensis TaxID=1185766 RepID=A0A074THF3_9RHOB|nr:glutamyl-tRNA amidotransferase [Thioclava dalianensis]SFN24289.1 amidase [Thioclava dalianensis]